MLDECVIDANVLGHSQNHNDPFFEAAVQLVGSLLDSSVVLCVDEGFSLSDGENQSIIGREYLDQLGPGSVAFAVLQQLSASGRVRFVSASIPANERIVIGKLVGRNTRDRHYVCVAFNTNGGVLVSHDHQDLTPDVRSKLKSKFSVRVVVAAVCCELISAA